MWENLKVSLKDPRFRIKAIAILVVAAIVISFILWFSFSADAISVSGFHYRFRVQNGYGGIFYPLNVSDGFDCVTGNFYAFQDIHLFDGNGDPVSVSTAYRTYTFDLSSLDMSYDYEIMVVSNNGAKISKDGFLTTLHTLGSSDPVFTTTRILYSPCNFYPDHVSFTASGNTGNIGMRSFTTGLNSLLVNGVLTLSLDSNSIGFVISVAGTDFQQLLYRAGVIEDSSQYFQLLDDVSSALASGDITPDQASIIDSTAANTQSQSQINRLVEVQNSLDAILQLFVTNSSGLSGSDLAAAYEVYNDRLYNVIKNYMGIIDSPDEAAALSSLYDVAVRQLEQYYQAIGSSSFYNQLDDTSDSLDSYHQYEQDIIDRVNSINVNNSLNLSSWVNTLSPAETSSFKTLFDSMMSNYSWSIFLQVPIYMTIIISLLGTSRNKEN